jgi:alanyl-tRNA synthetase
LYDTYGFPLDLTELILKEKGLSLNHQEFEAEMQAQKRRSKDASNLETHDWVELAYAKNFEFVGYDETICDIRIVKYRFVKMKSKKLFQVVFDKTPFYAESGGQIGDTGYIENIEEKIQVINTINENGLTLHLLEKLPKNINETFKAVVDENRRSLIANNHTATHILHFALRMVLGTHVEQKGSLVSSENLRFDFSHFQKLTDDEISKIEAIANKMIRENLIIEDFRSLPMNKAQELGAIALFGEKYEDLVRVVKFGDSIELCGGTHVKASGQIGIIKIVSESAIAAGIRRIEAVTSIKAEKLVNQNFAEMKQIKQLFNNPKNIVSNIEKLIVENKSLQKQLEAHAKDKVKITKDSLIKNITETNGINVICEKIEVDSATSVKDLAFQLKTQIDNLFLVIGAEINGKPNLTVMISENLVKEKNLNAGQIVRELAKEIQGGGGGQAFFANAGGKKVDGINDAISKAFEIIKNV